MSSAKYLVYCSHRTKSGEFLERVIARRMPYRAARDFAESLQQRERGRALARGDCYSSWTARLFSVRMEADSAKAIAKEREAVRRKICEEAA